MLTYIHRRVKKTEEVSEVVERIWQFLKYATPAMITALLAGVSHDSLLYKVVSYFLTPHTGG